VLRLQQWIKNVFVFAPLVFSLNFFKPDLFWITLLSFIGFSLVSSTVYIINDIADIEKDRHHPKKRHRPLPAGDISVSTACITSVVCLLAGLLLCQAVNYEVAGVAALYTLLNLFYTFRVKAFIILDAMFISFGFVLRVLTGAYAIAVSPSAWLLTATFFLALLLGLAKRYNEIIVLKDESTDHRPALEQYSETLLSQFLVIAATATVVSYALYTTDREVMAAFGTRNLVYTLPFVVYGVFRYLYLVYNRREGGDPTELVWKDRPLQGNLLLWVASVLLIIYGPIWWK
jgi:4-hydroxybenzoate polyprenyltransferase